MYYLMSLYLLPLRPTEAHWAVITGIPLWLSILSSWITSHIISTFVHARQCQEPFVWHKYKSKSSSPSGLRLLDTSYRCGSSCKVWTWVVSIHRAKRTRRANREAWQVHISMFYIASFMPPHVYIHHLIREHALQQKYVASVVCTLR